MSVFDQRNQNVTYQYNAAGNINFSAVHDRASLVTQLEYLHDELEKAVEQGAVDQKTGLDSQYQLKKTIMEAKASAPNKRTMLEQLATVKELLVTATAASGLVVSVVSAIELVQKLF